jgi:hypothetical protein
MGFKEACPLVRIEVLFIGVIEFGIPMKLVGLMKMYLK